MTKRIEIEVHGAKATFVLREDIAPNSTKALWETLPIEGTIRHGKLSGSACFVGVSKEPLASLPENTEMGVSSIYKGWLVVFPAPSRGSAELLISYGLAEYRWPTGRRLITPLAEIQGDGEALYAALERTHGEGETAVSIRRLDG